jgi:hypothetical protein
MEHRVLIIESINDRLSRKRAEITANTPQYRDLIIEHCFAVNPTIEDLKKIDVFQGPSALAECAAWEARGAPLTNAELKKIIETKVVDFNPDTIMLHTGFVFHKYPDTFLQVLEQIKIEHPSIKIGYQYRASEEHLLHYSIFDFDEITCEIEFKLFGRIPPR